MKISNVTAFGIFAGAPLPTLEQVEEGLSKGAFAPCGPTQESSYGFVPPRAAEGRLIEAVDGQWVARVAIETRSVPSAALRRAVDARAAEIEKTTGRKPGKKERKSIKEDMLLELLPRAFTKLRHVGLWIDPARKVLVLDTPSGALADDVATTLVQAVDGMVLMGLNTAIDPGMAMAGWLMDAEPPQGFTIDRDCELKATDESRAVVKYTNHPLDTTDVQDHIRKGMRPSKLAMTFEDRVSFVFTDGGALRSIAYLDGTMGGAHDIPEDEFDANVAICTGELSRLMSTMTAALGGIAQMEIGQSAGQQDDAE